MLLPSHVCRYGRGLVNKHYFCHPHISFKLLLANLDLASYNFLTWLHQYHAAKLQQAHWYYKVEIVCLSVCPRFTLERVELDPLPHIYFKSVSPGKYLSTSIWPHPFLYIFFKKPIKVIFSRKTNGAIGLKFGIHTTNLTLGVTWGGSHLATPLPFYV